MFNKKKRRTLFNIIDDRKSVVNDFLLRSTIAGFESYRTVDYRLYHKLDESEMFPLLNEHLAAFFAGDVDDGNCDMLDAVIFGAAREAVPDLAMQHYDHIDMLRRLTVRRSSDAADIRRIRESRLKERCAIQEDYDSICRQIEESKEVLQ